MLRITWSPVSFEPYKPPPWPCLQWRDGSNQHDGINDFSRSFANVLEISPRNGTFEKEEIKNLTKMAIFRSRDHGDIQRENHQHPLCHFLPISQGASYASAWQNVQWCLPLFQAHIAQAMACFIRWVFSLFSMDRLGVEIDGFPVFFLPGWKLMWQHRKTTTYRWFFPAHSESFSGKMDPFPEEYKWINCFWNMSVFRKQQMATSFGVGALVAFCF